MEAYLINGPTQGGGNKRGKRMARKRMGRDSKGRFLKRGGKRRTRRARRSVAPKVRRRRTHRRRHVVHAYTAHRHKRSITLTPHKKKWRVRQHMSNPVFDLGGITDSLITVGVLFGTLFVMGFANKQVQSLPIPRGKWLDLGYKLGLGLLGAWGARELARRRLIDGNKAMVAATAAFVPLGMGLLNEFVPAVAGQVSLAADETMGAELEGVYPQDLGLSPCRSPRSDYTICADLGAELEAESESGMY